MMCAKEHSKLSKVLLKLPEEEGLPGKRDKGLSVALPFPRDSCLTS